MFVHLPAPTYQWITVFGRMLAPPHLHITVFRHLPAPTHQWITVFGRLLASPHPGITRSGCLPAPTLSWYRESTTTSSATSLSANALIDLLCPTGDQPSIFLSVRVQEAPEPRPLLTAGMPLEHSLPANLKQDIWDEKYMRPSYTLTRTFHMECGL